jgi:dienelactone hydrolase
MRLFELLLVALTACTAVCLLMGWMPRGERWLSAGVLAAAILHGILEGARWQMIPAYAAVIILGYVVWKSARREFRFKKATSGVALLLVSASVLFSILLPMFHLPTPTGTYPVGTSILYFKDTSRIEDAAPYAGSARELMVQIWYPALASQNPFARYREPRETDLLSSYQSDILTNSRLNAPVAIQGAPFPVILFNPAWRGRRTNDTFLTEELASQGYIVVSIDHTYNARLVAFPDGRVEHGNASIEIDDPESSTPQRVRAIWNKELKKWVADERFVIDSLETMNTTAGSPWFGRMNTGNVGAIGHSFGGAAATAVCAEDHRVRASVNMDGWFFDAIRMRGPQQPLLIMVASTGEADVIPDSDGNVEAALDARDISDVKTSLNSFGGYLLTVKGASHEDFTDQPLVSPLPMLSHRGTISAVRIQKIVRSYVTAFFDKSLRSEDTVLLRNDYRAYNEVSLNTWRTNQSGGLPISGSGGQ